MIPQSQNSVVAEIGGSATEPMHSNYSIHNYSYVFDEKLEMEISSGISPAQKYYEILELNNTFYRQEHKHFLLISHDC